LRLLKAGAMSSGRLISDVMTSSRTLKKSADDAERI